MGRGEIYRQRFNDGSFDRGEVKKSRRLNHATRLAQRSALTSWDSSDFSFNSICSSASGVRNLTVGKRARGQSASSSHKSSATIAVMQVLQTDTFPKRNGCGSVPAVLLLECIRRDQRTKGSRYRMILHAREKRSICWQVEH